MLQRHWFSILILAVFMSGHARQSSAITRTWIGGADFWNIDGNWDPTGQPQPVDDAIVDGSPEVTDVEIFRNLTNLGSGNIRITTGTLQPVGNTTNTGTINIGDGSAIRSSFNPGNSTTLSGSGQVILQNSDNLPGSNATIVGGSNVDGAVTNAAGHTIRGEGSITLNWINEGTIIAEETTGDSSAVLRLNNIASFVNNGEFRSSPGATINLNFAQYSQGASGQLIADSDNITLTGGTSITGGSLETVGGGVFDANGLITLVDVIVNAPIDNSNTSGPINDARLFVSGGGITNNSTITVAGTSGRISQFGFTDPGTLDGTGEVVLIGGNSQTFIGVFPGIADEFIHGTNHTIRGAGGIGSPIINNGTIRAEVQGGNVLTINLPQTNNGLMEAASDAILRFVANVSNTTQSASGVISAADGGRVEFAGGQTITGGTLRSVGSGVIAIDENPPTFTDLTIDTGTNVNVAGGRTLRIAGNSITNEGTITLNSNSVNLASVLLYNNSLTLDGSGEVVLNTTGNNAARIATQVADTVLTNGADHTIRGSGFLAGPIVNNGLIAGDSSTNDIDVFARLSGTGTLKDVEISINSFVGTGVHAPGGSAPGTTTAIVPLEGSYKITHSQARLEIEIGGLTAGTEHDLLASTGTVSLGGVLDVRAVDLGNSYVPTAGDRFTIIQSTSAIAGTFVSTLFPSTGFGRTLTWQPVDYITDPNKVFLEIATVGFFDADFDEDGDVDSDDLTRWQAGYGTGSSHMQGDADADGDVDGRDFLRWQRQFGLGVPLGATTTSVPEPTTLWLALLGLAMSYRSRRPWSSR